MYIYHRAWWSFWSYNLHKGEKKAFVRFLWVLPGVTLYYKANLFNVVYQFLNS